MAAEADWLAVLRERCRRESQAAVARRLRCSSGTVSQLLSGSYGADTRRLEARVRGTLMAETVACPVLGELARDACARAQRSGSRAHAGPVGRELRLICPTCPNYLGRPAAGEAGDADG